MYCGKVVYKISYKVKQEFPVIQFDFSFSFVEKEIPVQSGQLYKNPDSHSRKVHEQALTGMFGRYT